MPRKRKRSEAKNKGTKRKKTKSKLNVRLTKLIEKVVVGSIWRVDTDDTETTATGKEVSSGWQRCRIIERFDETDTYPYG